MCVTIEGTLLLLELIEQVTDYLALTKYPYIMDELALASGRRLNRIRIYAGL
jgi:hypothetical protein